MRNRRVEALAERTESSTTWVNPDGTRTTEMNNGPIRVRRGDTWVPVDLTLVAGADGVVRPKAHPRDLAIAGAGDSVAARDLASVALGEGREVAVQWAGRLPAPRLEGNKATYPDVSPGVDLVVEATRTGFEQFLVVKSRQSKALTLTLPVRAKGLTAKQDADGNSDLVDAAGTVVGSIPAAEAWDAQVDQRSGGHAKLRKVGKAVQRGAFTDVLIDVAADFLGAADTQYPVTVDPAVTVWTNFDTFVQSSIANTDQSGSTELRIGTYDGGTTKARSYLHFDMTPFRGTHVLSSTLWLYENWSYSCSARNWEVWSTPLVGTGTRWSNMPAPWNKWATPNDTRGHDAGCGANWTGVDIKTLAQTWSDQNFTNAGVMLKSESETDSYGWKKFSSSEGGAVPHIDITYNTRPSPSTGLNVTDRGDTGGVTYTRSLTPTLSVPVNDPDGDQVNAQFYIYENDTLITHQQVGPVTSGSVATWKVPDGVLQAGHTYRFRASSNDGTDWAGDGFVALRNKMGGRVVEAAGCSRDPGTILQLADYSGAGCQRFTLSGVGGGLYTFVGHDSYHVLDIANCGVDNPTWVNLWYNWDNDCQKWRLETAGNGEYKIKAKYADKSLDPIGCTGAAGSRIGIWNSYTTDCEIWKLDLAPDAGVTVQWLQFTVDTDVPGAPFVASTDYPTGGVWAKAAGQAGTFTFDPPVGVTDVAGYVYALDATPSTDVAADVNGKATPSITPAADGQHLLNVRTKDKAGNLSPIVTYKFNVGRGGLVDPADGARVVSRTALRVEGDPTLTHVKFVWRRDPQGTGVDIPVANLTKANGSALAAGFTQISGLGGSATWNVSATTGSAGGVLQVQAILASDATGTVTYPTAWKTITVDPDADGAESEGIGGGSLNLQTGDFGLSAMDAQEFGLSVSRTSSSRDPKAGYQFQRERLTANQQKVGTDTTGFTAPTSVISRATTRGRSATDSLQVLPPASGANADTYATLDGEYALRLGMKAGHLYRASGWIYVPAATTLTPADSRGLRIVGYYRNSAGQYVETDSPRPAITDGWAQVSVDMAVPAGATEAFFRLYNGFSPGSGKAVFFDDMSVREITAPFGPQWETGTSADSSEVDWSRLDFPDTGLAQVEQVDGGKVWFTRSTTGAFFPEPGAEQLTLTADGVDYKLTEVDGTVTIFTKSADGGSYLVSSTTPPVAASATRFIYETVDDQVRVKRAIAPTEPGVGDCTTATPARGCEALDYEYATSTTATASVFGDIVTQVRAVWAWTTDPATGTVERKEVVHYAYDDTGKLREAWDPRLATPLKTSYTYTNDRVTQVTATGDLPWYYDFGTVGTDTNPGRLLKVRRAALAQGTAATLDGEIATTVVYNVPITRGAGGPYDLDGTTVATWAQKDVAAEATAIFGPEDPVTVNTATSSVPGANGYAAATVHYLDASGREVNTATPGGYIDTTEFDRFGNTVRSLEASNRALALGQGTDAASQLSTLGLAQYDTATRAIWLDSQATFSADGLDEVASLGPLHRVALDADPNQLVNARHHSLTTYDEGRPDGTAYHLATTSRDGAQVVGMTGDQDVKVNKTGYTPAIGGTSGWALRQATTVTLDAEAPVGSLGSATTSVRFDAQGRALESRRLGAGPTDAGTTLVIFYTALANPDDSRCGNRPEWAGQACITRSAGAVTGHDATRMPADLSVKWVESYSRFGEADKITETAAGKTRTTRTTYDSADRVASVEITGDVGTAIQKITTTYDAATGDAITSSLVDGTGTPTASISRVFDKLGRITKYTDADGAWTSSEYDRFGKPAKVTDSLGTTQTFTYDRALEPRGLLTKITDSVAGDLTAKYGPDGQITEQGLPGGVKVTNTLDPSGKPTNRAYTRTSDGVVIAYSHVVDNIRGQALQQDNSSSWKTFAYDRWGRLTTAQQQSRSTGVIVQRGYTYDQRSNRTGKTTKTGSVPWSLPLAGDPVVSQTNTYDSADRITNTGYVYDAFGRITSTPSGVTNSYYVNDLVAGQQTASARMSWTLDPALRFRRFTSEKWVSGAWANAVTKVNHYGADGDEPRWIAEDITQANNVTRNVDGPDGDLAVTTGQTAAAGVTLQMTSLHGDVMATVAVNTTTNTITGAVTLLDSDEFGMPSTETPAAATARYGWLGGKDRSSEALGGAVLMGVRLYDPASGRFWQQDPEPGGSATPYDYCGADPVNCTDLDGRGFWSWVKNTVAPIVAKVAEVASYIPGPIGGIAAAVSAGAYAITGNWSKAGEMALTAASSLIGANTAVKASMSVVKVASKVVPKAVSSARKAGRALATGARKIASKCNNSFAPDTPILMADGTLLPIDQIQEGDLVAASDPATGDTVAEPVVNVITGYGVKHLIEFAIDGGDKPIIATANHPIWIDGRGWTDAENIGIGDRVLIPGGATATIRHVRDLGTVADRLVYNLTVADLHTYSVVTGDTPIVVHNASCLAANRAAGKALEKRVEQALHKRYGAANVERQKYFRTPMGKRYADFHVNGPAGKFNVEVKAGRSRYGSKQRKKDDWINQTHGIPTYVIRR
ncbi:MAG TPA: DNRLRE domain-containing protein [Actinokineospora sp.]|nr:DNRLRE domain-containing protein [Actinokineospora sp.]